MLRALVVGVHRRAHQMLYRQRLQRSLMMGDIAVIDELVRADKARRGLLSGVAGGSGGGDEPPEGAEASG